MLLVSHIPCTVVPGKWVHEFRLLHLLLHCIGAFCWKMPMNGIVPIPCAAAVDGVVNLPVALKPHSKLSGAWACQVVWSKVLEHVPKRHENHAVLRKSTPLVEFSSSLVLMFILPQEVKASSPPMPKEAKSPSLPPAAKSKLAPPPACRLPLVAAPVVPAIGDCSWHCLTCTYEQDVVPQSRTCIMCHSTRWWLLRGPQHAGVRNAIVQSGGRGKLASYPHYNCPNCCLASQCSACRVARHAKLIHNIWNKGNGPIN